MYMYVYVYIYMYVCLYVCIYIFVCKRVSVTREHFHICTSLYILHVHIQNNSTPRTNQMNARIQKRKAQLKFLV